MGWVSLTSRRSCDGLIWSRFPRGVVPAILPRYHKLSRAMWEILQSQEGLTEININMFYIYLYITYTYTYVLPRYHKLSRACERSRNHKKDSEHICWKGPASSSVKLGRNSGKRQLKTQLKLSLPQRNQKFNWKWRKLHVVGPLVAMAFPH